MILPVFRSRVHCTWKMIVLRVRRRPARFSPITPPTHIAGLMHTRLIVVAPELPTYIVSGLFETNRPHGNAPTATPLGANVFEPFDHTSRRLKLVFERNTLPRSSSTARSPAIPARGSANVRPYAMSVVSAEAFAWTVTGVDVPSTIE